MLTISYEEESKYLVNKLKEINDACDPLVERLLEINNELDCISNPIIFLFSINKIRRLYKEFHVTNEVFRCSGREFKRITERLDKVCAEWERSETEWRRLANATQN